jgi:outer membrane protein OmpA-like peptidoglycan-associated protein
VITTVSPAHGPEAGGNTVTITGTGFSAVTSITLGATTIRKPAYTVNAAGTEITFVVPKGVGGMDIALNAGTAEADTSYAYDAPFHAVVIPTPANPDGGPAADLSLKLKLKLNVGSKLSGQKVQITGGGLKANSEYLLEMHSDPLMVWTGTTDANGNFDETVTLPATVCLAAGKHDLKLSGVTPENKETSDTGYFALTDGCIVGAQATKTSDKEWTLNGFLFGYCSAKLSAGGKQSLDALVEFIQGAKTVTILGYTETDTKSAAIKKSNLKLAKDRTKTVAAYLKAKGIVATYVTIGKGGVDPVSTTDQSKNRRVVIKAHY